MPLIIGLAAIIIIAGVYLIYTSRSKEENAKMDSFLGKVKGAMAPKPGAEPKEAPVEKYEKSDDGKVVYAFKRGDEAVGAETSTGTDGTPGAKTGSFGAEAADAAAEPEGDKEA